MMNVIFDIGMVLVDFYFEDFVRSSFNKMQLNASDVINEWNKPSSSKYERWLLNKYVQHTSFAKSYPRFAK